MAITIKFASINFVRLRSFVQLLNSKNILYTALMCSVINFPKFCFDARTFCSFSWFYCWRWASVLIRGWVFRCWYLHRCQLYLHLTEETWWPLQLALQLRSLESSLFLDTIHEDQGIDSRTIPWYEFVIMFLWNLVPLFCIGGFMFLYLICDLYRIMTLTKKCSTNYKSLIWLLMWHIMYKVNYMNYRMLMVLMDKIDVYDILKVCYGKLKLNQ